MRHRSTAPQHFDLITAHKRLFLIGRGPMPRKSDVSDHCKSNFNSLLTEVGRSDDGSANRLRGAIASSQWQASWREEYRRRCNRVMTICTRGEHASIRSGKRNRSSMNARCAQVASPNRRASIGFGTRFAAHLLSEMNARLRCRGRQAGSHQATSSPPAGSSLRHTLARHDWRLWESKRYDRSWADSGQLPRGRH